MDGEEIFLVTSIVLLCLGCLVFGGDHVLNSPYAAENALQQCQERGFDYVEWFSRPILSQEAMGVKCGLIDYSQKRVDIESKNAGTLVIS